MTLRPEDVEALFQGKISGGFQGGGPVDDENITEEERTWRVLRLRQVLAAVQHAWETGSDELDRIAEKLGDGSRDASWRIALGESGIVDFFLRLLPHEGLRQFLRIQTLRIIGNSCADTDENRARAVELGTLSGPLLRLLSDDSSLPFVIPVLFNVCVDYDPAQLQACNAGLSRNLVALVSSPRLGKCRPFLNIICKILGLLIAQEPEPNVANPATPALLLNLATSKADPPDLEEFSGLVSVALAYLTHEQIQVHFLNTRGFVLLQQAFEASYIHFDIASEEDPEELAQLKQAWNAFVQVFADISSLPNFTQLYPLQSPAVALLVSWLSRPASYTHLQVAACLCLGNVARSDETSKALVHQVYQPLLNILLNNGTELAPPPKHPGGKVVSPPSQLLHAALSFLKNLAIAPENKPLIGGLLDRPQSVLPRLWSTTDVQPQTQFAAISLTRLLLTGCPDNVRRICAPLSADPDSPAHQRSNVHVLIDLYDRVDAEPSKLEAARAVAAVCRVLHSHPVLPVLPDEWSAAETDLLVYRFEQPPPPPTSTPVTKDQSLTASPSGLHMNIFDNHVEDVRVPVSRPGAPPDEVRRANFYALHTDIATPLGSLLSQKKFPTLRSEVLFVLALMCRSIDGAQVVLRTLCLVETSVALIEVISGQDILSRYQAGQDVAPASTAAAKSADAQLVDELGLQPEQADPQQSENLIRVDRQNGMVALAELLKNFSQYMPPIRKSVFEEVLAKGGEMVAQDLNKAVGAPGSSN